MARVEVGEWGGGTLPNGESTLARRESVAVVSLPLQLPQMDFRVDLSAGGAVALALLGLGAQDDFPSFGEGGGRI